jgi:hypothetical protein
MVPTASGNRKMRRTRDAAVSANSAVDGNSSNDGPGSDVNLLDGYDLYNINGDASEALKVFQHHQQQSKNISKDYDITGVSKSDTAGSVSIASKYNCMILSQIASNKKKKSPANTTGAATGASSSYSWKSVFMNKLDEIEAQYLQEQDKGQNNPLITASSATKKRRNEYILSYNRMLGLFGSGDIQQCATIFSKNLSNAIEKYRMNLGKKKNVTSKPDPNFPADVAVVAVRMAFLIFECVLSMSVGRNSGLCDIASSMGIPFVDDIVNWLESLPVIYSGNTPNGTSGTAGVDNNKEMQQLRFLFNLYKSRLALANLHTETGTHVDANLRSARKDMKTAMEIFQNKLRPTFGTTGSSSTNSNTAETGSVVSSANSEENLSMAGGSNHHIKQQQTPHHHHETTTVSSNVVLQKLNQSALGLKAHLEQLKGNTKKSLILCSEAIGSVDERMGSYEAIHANNLAVIYETNERRQLALHALTKSLRASSADMGGTSVRGGDCEDDNKTRNNADAQYMPELSVPLFYRDGTVRPNFMTSLTILHNAAICALRARNYISAYECFATCVTRSDIFANRQAIWLRMSEACFGIWSSIKKSRATLPLGHCVKGLQVNG